MVKKISWREFSEKVMLTAKAMAEFGIEVQEKIGIYSQNMPQCLFTDFGAYGNRVISIPMYATNSPAQIEYIINDAGDTYAYLWVNSCNITMPLRYKKNLPS